MRFSASVPAPETAVAPLDRLAAMATAVARPLAKMADPRSVSINTLAALNSVGVASESPRTKALTSFCTSLRLRLTPTDTDLLAPVVLAEMPIALAATSDSMRVLPLAWMLTSPPAVTVAALSMVASVLAAILLGFWYPASYAPTLFPLLGLGLSALLCWQWLQPFKQLCQQSRNLTDDAVARYVYTGRNDDIGQLQLVLRSLEAETAGVVGRVAAF